MFFQSRRPRLSDEGREFIAILSRYPTLGDGELERLRALSAKLRMGDLAQISRSEELAGKMFRFYDDNIETLEPAPCGFMAAIAGAAIAIGLLLQGWRWPA